MVVGAGQSPDNGRATVLRFAEVGAKVPAVDNRLTSAEETAALAAEAIAPKCLAIPLSSSTAMLPPSLRPSAAW
jgi:hypothetical protein